MAFFEDSLAAAGLGGSGGEGDGIMKGVIAKVKEATKTRRTKYEDTAGREEARARIDAQMAKWRASKTPPVERADDPRHKEVWPLLNKYVPDWKSETRVNGNALVGQSQPVSNNALASGPFDSPDVQNDILNQYYGGSGPGMFVK